MAVAIVVVVAMVVAVMAAALWRLTEVDMTSTDCLGSSDTDSTSAPGTWQMHARCLYPSGCMFDGGGLSMSEWAPIRCVWRGRERSP